MPKQDEPRKALGLAPLGLAPVCATCGEVHTTKRCTQSKPRKPRHRRALPFAPGSAARAARIVERHAPSAEWLAEFREALGE